MTHTTETESLIADPAIAAAVRPALVIIHHPDWDLVGARAVLRESGALLGRHARTVFPGVFDHAKVSREHARVVVRAGRLTVEDLGSRNGTHVNGARIERHAVSPGDVIRVGPVLLLVDAAPAAYVDPRHGELLGTSWRLAELVQAIERVALQPHTVTVLGETGTGKELTARAIHNRSGRAGPLVAVNCGALAEGVLASELFGHARGAYSGAVAARDGLVARAEGGTLFLDEVASAPASMQTALLRLLETGDYRPVGSSESRHADVRVVAAAQPDLEVHVDRGVFRQDLWFRLTRRVVRVPPLRERRADITQIAAAVCRRHDPELRLGVALSLAITRYHWPGNVRELITVVERTIESSPTAAVLDDPTHVPARAQEAEPGAAAGARLRRPKQPRPDGEALRRLLRKVDGSVKRAADELRVDRKTIYRWLEAYAIDVDELRG